jgi:hypothetical protein
MANAEDFDIPRCVADGDEAVAIIRDNLAKWRGEPGPGPK